MGRVQVTLSVADPSPNPLLPSGSAGRGSTRPGARGLSPDYPFLRREGGWGGRFLVVAALLAFGPGCAGSKLWKQTELPAAVPEGVPTAPLSSSAKFENTPVVQASAISKFTRPAKVPANEMTLLWRNRIDYLPDPGRNGEMGPGLVGQLFLFGSGLQFAEANGKLTVALYDESPRPPGQQPNQPEGWEFTKETLQKLKTPDERFGMSYALFLPWPTYRPDVTRVRIAVRYDPEQGHPLFAPETRVTIDTSMPGGSTGNSGSGWTNQPHAPGAAQQSTGFSPIGGPAPGSGPAPAGYGLQPAGGMPMSGFHPMPGGQQPVGPGMPMMPLVPPPGHGSVHYGALQAAPVGYGMQGGLVGPAGGVPGLGGLPPSTHPAPRPNGN